MAERQPLARRRLLLVGWQAAVRASATTGLVGLGLSMRTARAEEQPQQPATVGRPAPDFKLQDLNGRSIELQRSARAHDVTVLNFWATWCAPCVPELREFDEMLRGWHEPGAPSLSLLAINALESAEKVRAFAQKHPLGLPLLLDPEGEALGSYVGFGAGLPMSFLIDARGVLRQRVVGAIKGEELKRRVLALAAAGARPAGTPPPPR